MITALLAFVSRFRDRPVAVSSPSRHHGVTPAWSKWNGIQAWRDIPVT